MANPNSGDGRNNHNGQNQHNSNQNILPLQHSNSHYGGRRDTMYSASGEQRRIMTPSHIQHHRGARGAMSPMAHGNMGDMGSGPVTRSSIRWQDSADNTLRKRMIQQIIRLLRAKKPEASQEWIRKLPDMAKKLEDNLFYQSKSQQDYSDPETLTRRLQAIALKITRDRKRQQQQQQQQQQMLRQGGNQPPPLNRGIPPFDRRDSVRSMRRSPFPVDHNANAAPPGPFPRQERRPETRSGRTAVAGASLAPEGNGGERNKAMVLKQQQHRLLLLRHASRCTFPPGHCQATKHCEAYKRLWVHIASCRNQQCDTPHCVSSRYVLAHYHRCQEVHCAVCRPVRDAISKQNQMKMQQQQQQGRATSRASVRRPSLRTNGMDPMPPQNFNRHSPFSFQHPQPQTLPQSSPTAAPVDHERHGFANIAPGRMQQGTPRNTDIESRMAELERRRKALDEKKRKEAEEEEAIKREYQRLQSMKSSGMSQQRTLSRTTNMQSRAGSSMPFAPSPTNDFHRINHQDSAQSLSKRMAITPGSVGARPMSQPVPHQQRHDPVAVRKERLINSLKSMQNQTSLVYTFGIKEIEEHVKSLSFKCASSSSIYLKPTELRVKAISLLKMLMDEEFSWIFNKPVDPVDLGIPDYFEVIKKPMDLGTVKKNVETNYYKSLKDFANDVRLVFNNAMLYNPESGDVHGIARQYGFKFEKAYNTMLRDMKKEAALKRKNDNACKLCGGEKYTFEPPVYYCSGKCNQKIRRGAFFYMTPDNKQYYCLTCYNSWLKDVVMLEDGSELPKIKLKKRKNDEVQEESWVECNMCKRWYHQICVLFNSRRNDQSRNEPFYCPICVLRYIEQLRAEKLPQKADIKFSAADLPRSGYSDFLEMRVKQRIIEARKNFARSRKIPLNHVTECAELTIRVVSCRDVDLIPRAGLERLYGESHKYPKSFSHRVKCILLFQKVDGVDLLILGLYTQVYGSDCPGPNSRTLYIAYLDSVNYFTPVFCRTPVYKELLQSTLEFEKKRGITKTFIWVCPPLAGDDYILYCHPKDQKTPKAEMLRNWYFSLLEDCRKRGVIVSIDNLYDAYFQRMCCVTSVPNFDGDYWPGVTEQFIQQLENDKIDPKSIAPRKKRTFSRNKSSLEKGNKKRTKSKGKKQSKSKKKKSKSKSKKSEPPQPPAEVKMEVVQKVELEAKDKDDAMTEEAKEITAQSFKPPKPLPCLEMPQQDALTVKIADVIQQMKDDFMVVYMHHICSSCNCDIDKPGQVYWLPEKYDAAALDLDYTKNRYAPPYALCDVCFKQKWVLEYPDTELTYDGLQIEKISNREEELENVRGFGTSNNEEENKQMITDAVKDILTKLCEKVETDASASNIDENDDLFDEDDSKKGGRAKNGKERMSASPIKQESMSVPLNNKMENVQTPFETSVKVETPLKSKPPKLTVQVPVTKASESVLMTPRSTNAGGQGAQPDEIITVLPEGQNAERRSAWLEAPCTLLQMKPFKTQVPEETIDTDAVIESQFFDTRQQFLSLCQGNKYQFDQLRRAKHSSMMVLYHLHNPSLPSFLHTCNNCRMNIVTGERFSCKTCDDFDLCEKCSRSVSHPHPLHSASDPTNSRVIPAYNQGFPQTAKGMKAAGMQRRYGQEYYQNQRHYQSNAAPQPKIQAHMALLVHASNCQKQNCGNKHCSRMRQLLKHGASCKVRVRGQCKICKRIWGLLHLHSRHCKVKGSCNVPGCNKLRAHLRRQEQHQDRRIRMHTQRMQQERLQAQQMPPQRSPIGDSNNFSPSSPSMDVQRGAKQGKHIR